MSTFTWLASYATSKEAKLNLRKAQFGDGYVQRSSSGINNIAQKWSVALSNRRLAEKNAIEDYLRARSVGVSFYWTPPGETALVRVLCEEWSITPIDYGIFSINAVFEQMHGEGLGVPFVLKSNGVTFIVPGTARNSAGTSFTVPGTARNSAGTPFTVI